MIPFLARRLGQGVVVLLLVSVVTFAIMMAAPGGPSLLADPKLSVAERTAIEQRLGVQTYLTSSPLLAVYPGVLILATVLAVNALGDALRRSVKSASRSRV